MPIKRPDIYENNNPNNAIVDSDGVKGGPRVVNDLTALYALGPKADQLKLYVTRVYVISESKTYQLISMSNIGNSSGWKDTTPATPAETVPRVLHVYLSSEEGEKEKTLQELEGVTVIAIDRGGLTQLLPEGQTPADDTLEASFSGLDGTIAFGVPFYPTQELIRIWYYMLNNKLNQYIDFPEFETKFIDDPDFTPTVSVNTSLPLVLTSSDPTIATIVGGAIHIVSDGAVTITATQVGNDNYNPASKTQTLLIIDPDNNAVLPYVLPFVLLS